MSEALQKGVLHLDADLDGSGRRYGEFHFVGNIQATQEVEPNYVLSGAFSNLNAVLSRIDDIDLVTDDKLRNEFYWDLGGGRHAFQIRFKGWEGAPPDVQWGDGTSDPNDPDDATIGDATGCDPLTQMQVFLRYIQQSTNHSFDPAELEIGHYSENGMYEDYIPVAIESPRGMRAAQDYSSFDGQITLVEVARLDGPIDELEQLLF